MSTNIDPFQGAVYSPISYKVQIKTTIVKFLSQYCNNSVSNTMNHVNTTLDYPMTAEQYPCIIVGYEEESLNSSGLGHEEDYGNTLTERWSFSGKVILKIWALSSLERDYIADYIVALSAFGVLDGLPFYPNIIENQTVDIQPNISFLEPTGEQVTSGAAWGLTDQRIYQCGYRFPLLGAFTSTPSYSDFITAAQAAVATFTEEAIYNAPAAIG